MYIVLLSLLGLVVPVPICLVAIVLGGMPCRQKGLLDTNLYAKQKECYSRHTTNLILYMGHI
jgi:hypothetical protein